MRSSTLRVVDIEKCLHIVRMEEIVHAQLEGDVLHVELRHSMRISMCLQNRKKAVDAFESVADYWNRRDSEQISFSTREKT